MQSFTANRPPPGRHSLLAALTRMPSRVPQRTKNICLLDLHDHSKPGEETLAHCFDCYQNNIAGHTVSTRRLGNSQHCKK